MPLRVAAVAAAIVAFPSAGRPQDNLSASFEVASVRPSDSRSVAQNIRTPHGGRFNAVNVTVATVIKFAYEVLDVQLVGAPEWTRTERFEITAKLEGDTGRPADVAVAVQRLLAERFGLVVRREKRELPVYFLVVARPGRELPAMIKPSRSDCSPEAVAARRAEAAAAAPRGATLASTLVPGKLGMCTMVMTAGPSPDSARIIVEGTPLAPLVRTLSGQTGRVVVDRTGMSGNWDYELTFARRPSSSSDSPSLFTALEEQLGLKLQSGRDLVETLVIERVERPTANE